MMNTLTPFANELGLNFAFTATAVTRPTTLYLARHVGSTDDAGSINEETVTNDTNYARLPITFGDPVWSSALGLMTVSNSGSALTLTPAVAAGTRSYYAWSIWDAATGGNCLAVLPFISYTVEASNGVPREIQSGAITIGIRVAEGSALTEFGAEMMLKYIFTSSAITRPIAWLLSLHTASPGTDGSANELTTSVDSDYTQKAVSFGTPATVDDTEIRNSTSVLWTPAAGSVYDVTHIGIKDNATGNSLAINALLNAKSSSSPISVSENFLSIKMKK
jgi:hypothetical protein